MATITTWRRTQCLRWLHGQEGDYHNGLDGYIDKMATTTLSKMATWTGWILTQCLKWLHRQEEATTVSKMTTWKRWRRLPQCLRGLHGKEEVYHSGLDDYIDKMATTTLS